MTKEYLLKENEKLKEANQVLQEKVDSYFNQIQELDTVKQLNIKLQIELRNINDENFILSRDNHELRIVNEKYELMFKHLTKE